MQVKKKTEHEHSKYFRNHLCKKGKTFNINRNFVYILARFLRFWFCVDPGQFVMWSKLTDSSPSPLIGPSCVINRKPSPSGSYYNGGGGRMPRSPSDHGLDYRARSPHGWHGNGEEELHGGRRPIRDGRGRWHSQVSQEGFI